MSIDQNIIKFILINLIAIGFSSILYFITGIFVKKRFSSEFVAGMQMRTVKRPYATNLLTYIIIFIVFEATILLVLLIPSYSSPYQILYPIIFLITLALSVLLLLK